MLESMLAQNPARTTTRSATSSLAFAGPRLPLPRVVSGFLDNVRFWPTDSFAFRDLKHVGVPERCTERD